MAPSSAGRKLYSSRNNKTPRSTNMIMKKIWRIWFWLITVLFIIKLAIILKIKNPALQYIYFSIHRFVKETIYYTADIKYQADLFAAQNFI